MAVQRCQIGVNFSYSSNGTLIPIPANTPVAIIDRSTSSPALVYGSLTGTTTIAAVRTDAGGNVPGFVTQGSYTITAASVPSASPPYPGVSIAWEAVRGDGVENYAPNSIPPGALQSGVVQGGLPAGVILDYAGPVAPAGFLLCDGASYLSTIYPGLYGAIQYTYGGSGGSFAVPDFRGRVSVGVGSGAGLTVRSLGGRMGEENHGLGIGEIPAHTHGGTTGSAGSHTHGGTTGVDTPDHIHFTTATTDTDSPDHAHATSPNVLATSGAQGNVQVAIGTGYNVAYSTGAGWGLIGGTVGANTRHTHTFSAWSVGASARHAHAINPDGTHTHSIPSDGSGGSHNNMQPSLVLNKVIKT